MGMLRKKFYSGARASRAAWQLMTTTQQGEEKHTTGEKFISQKPIFFSIRNTTAKKSGRRSTGIQKCIHAAIVHNPALYSEMKKKDNLLTTIFIGEQIRGATSYTLEAEDSPRVRALLKQHITWELLERLVGVTSISFTSADGGTDTPDPSTAHRGREPLNSSNDNITGTIQGTTPGPSTVPVGESRPLNRDINSDDTEGTVEGTALTGPTTVPAGKRPLNEGRERQHLQPQRHTNSAGGSLPPFYEALQPPPETGNEEDKVIVVSVPFNLWGSVTFQQFFGPQTQTQTQQTGLLNEGASIPPTSKQNCQQQPGTSQTPVGVWDEEVKEEHAPFTKFFRGNCTRHNEGG